MSTTVYLINYGLDTFSLKRMTENLWNLVWITHNCTKIIGGKSFDLKIDQRQYQ